MSILNEMEKYLTEDVDEFYTAKPRSYKKLIRDLNDNTDWYGTTRVHAKAKKLSSHIQHNYGQTNQVEETEFTNPEGKSVKLIYVGNSMNKSHDLYLVPSSSFDWDADKKNVSSDSRIAFSNKWETTKIYPDELLKKMSERAE